MPRENASAAEAHSTRSEPAIPLSVVIAATRPWPDTRLVLDPLLDQAAALGAEIVVADQSGHALPEDCQTRFPSVVWLKRPGLSIFQLRAAAVEVARGEIVAITEDHCRPSQNWCASILESHRKHPKAAMIGGGVANGATGDLTSWAGFLLANGPVMEPVECPLQDAAALQANVSYKRRFAPTPCPSQGYMEWIHNCRLRSQGEELVADDSLKVSHEQQLSFGLACSINFHGGRTVAGFRLEDIGLMERLMRLAICPVMPLLYYGRAVVAACAKRRYLPQVAICTPLMLALAVCRSAGALTGLLTGYGRSPMKMA